MKSRSAKVTSPLHSLILSRLHRFPQSDDERCPLGRRWISRASFPFLGFHFMHNKYVCWWFDYTAASCFRFSGVDSRRRRRHGCFLLRRWATYRKDIVIARQIETVSMGWQSAEVWGGKNKDLAGQCPQKLTPTENELLRGWCFGGLKLCRTEVDPGGNLVVVRLGICVCFALEM